MQSQKSFAKDQTSGILYLVPTPIGNLGDMTFRSVETLKKVDVIASEDTRNTQKLLNHFDIETKQISFHEYNTRQRVPELVKRLLDGENIAQVSDAGMPSISDPGHDLVVACIKQHISVVPLPGANAGLTALIASGLSPQPFYFFGFLNRKQTEQKQQLEKLVNKEETLIIYEAPHRLKKTLTNMNTIFGEERQAVLCRELTKKFEEFLRGSLQELLTWATENEIRGEFVIIVEGNQHASQASTEALPAMSLEDQITNLISAGEKPNDAIKQVAKLRGLRKQDVYATYHHLRDSE
ncbi:16S rRNA (cytidine(1402)-2'-O)-methyltransferase [Pediococcus ethanolidurans]|uniref:Ribosomal RNA small subunit methyltransferase I n=1 Tax=Pediococcus ethanolidurans TaxID=319653 RepID=A0A0R2K947_9LACO|nr:16S rRNA (cytidine(1402)-2'-O)-methyltransferase [Pediococcus ethanolidurans]KRN82804.1 Tetrapyrrole (Corrin Porphyrin) methylase family protein [Pediococcus ethanolidurans]MBU7555197.1 16S rRNA (cytidine(1402)-2'-O)-methyltransferase [Pediococcus ethanolidurans]MBU7562825.1 16S rRNA (cytidine(1402)-2'-O)-methyltransferase [Pediococcus ethanolidurans]MCT4398020.1 16S rRNA (cytidine(1402)-2'-O)-methyltransferase [Pediococcus ethanolidurans]MCV3314784.1 16S rRNA (cytidine(1402)-2'-O)-methyltr